MDEANHYKTLNVPATASQADIKRAYRRLAKEYHPDCTHSDSRDRMVRLNAAYEVLGDRTRRQRYDRAAIASDRVGQRGWRSSAAPPRPTGASTDDRVVQWLKRVYAPLNAAIDSILEALPDEIDELAADPFDDELVAGFSDYLQRCRQELERAEKMFRSLPNPSVLAGVATNLYYCLNQLDDGVEELEYFTFNYDDRHLSTGRELFRIAEGLQWEARSQLGDFA